MHALETEQTVNSRESGTVPFWRTFFYSLGNAAGLLLYTTFNNYIQFFYTDVQRVPPQWIGRGWFAFGFWNAINDPISGWLSDRTSTRWGRRRFYIGLLAIPTAIVFALVWLPPFDSSNPRALLVYFLVIISIYDILQSIVTLNQDALFPEMYQEMENRVKGSSIRQLVGAVGNGCAVALTPAIYDKYGWDVLAMLWGTLAALLYFVSLVGIQEDPIFSKQERTSWREQIRAVFDNRTFLIVFGISFAMRFILAAIVSGLPFYAEYVLQIEKGKFSKLLLALLVTSGVSVVLWQWIIKRYGTRSAMIASMIITGMVAFPLLFTVDIVQTAVTLACVGAAMGGTILGPEMLFAEVVDEDYVKTGLRREGMYRGFLGFIFRFPPALIGLILGEGLAFAGYNADLEAAMQPAAVGTVIRLFLVILPLLGLVGGVGLLRAYPLHGAYFDDIQRRAAALRQAAHQSTE